MSKYKNEIKSKINILLYIACFSLILGFSIMSTGERTFSIIILIITYLIIIPVAIIKTKNDWYYNRQRKDIFK